MLRARTCVIALMVIIAAGIGAAQETADIVVGGQVVARVRDAGQYETVEHRVAAIDEAVNQVLASTDDPGSLDVTLEQMDGRWTILIDGTPIMQVYEAEAEANETSPGVLGALWVRKFRDALPDATPVSVEEVAAPVEGPAEDTGEEAPAETEAAAETAVDEPTVDAAGVSDEPTTGAVTNTGTATVEILEVPADDSEPEAEEVVASQGARLLILEAFNQARELSENDYLVQRETMANDLFSDLVEVLTGGRASGRIEAGGTAPSPTSPTVPPTIAETAPAETAPQPATEEVTEVQPEVAEEQPVVAPPVTAAALAMSDEARARIEARIPASDPSYANVVQKVAVKAKFRAATTAYREALAADPDTAAQARELLTAAREANAGGQFAEAEDYLDSALHLLGVTQWEQHIDAAMADLGLVE